jgi:MFS family permease
VQVETAGPKTKPRDTPSRATGGFVLSVLILAYTFAYIDRTLLSLLVQPIRHSLHISDLQLSLLSGFAFALFYTCLGLPIGRLVDTGSRRLIIVLGIAGWSTMTALCGLTSSFWQLFLARVGVGIGEAALSPGAYSLLSDVFPPRSLPRALSIYSAAIYIGSGLALIGGGALIGLAPRLSVPGFGVLEPWQSLFVLVGLPGFGVALLMLTVREPARNGVSAALGRASLSDGTRYLWRRRRAYGLMIGGYAAASLLWNGTMAWLPSYFQRMHHWGLPHVGLVLGLALVIGGSAGIAAGGAWAGWRRRRGDVAAGLKIGIVSAMLVLPCGILLPLMPGDILPVPVLALFVLFGSLPYGAAAAALQDVTPNQLRGQVSALYLFGLNLAGIGAGPTLVAFLAAHVFNGDMSLGPALSLLAAMVAPLGGVLLALAVPAYRRAAAENDF